MDLEQRVEYLENEIKQLVSSSHYTIFKDMQMYEGRNIQVGKNVGTIIGTESSQKLGFFGTAPTTKQSAVGYPSGGSVVDSQARSAITLLINALHNLGLTS